MSCLVDDDAPMHYEDGSHRWCSPDPARIGDQQWRLLVQAHVEAHQEDLDGGYRLPRVLPRAEPPRRRGGGVR